MIWLKTNLQRDVQERKELCLGQGLILGLVQQEQGQYLGLDLIDQKCNNRESPSKELYLY